jgi:hypothetical protein
MYEGLGNEGIMLGSLFLNAGGGVLDVGKEVAKCSLLGKSRQFCERCSFAPTTQYVRRRVRLSGGRKHLMGDCCKKGSQVKRELEEGGKCHIAGQRRLGKNERGEGIARHSFVCTTATPGIS